jgi:NAD(P)-dependent dehydrogenase (short-subunit alcohol dehydrogenase family)
MSNQQVPIQTGFGATSTASEVLGDVDLIGKTVIVTGGYSGLGLEITRVLAGAGAEIVVPARTPQKAAAALRDLARVQQASLDLMDPASIDAFARTFLDRGGPLHILIGNAGIMATPLTRDLRGFESQWSTNHLGHFQLAAALWPALRRASGARVVSVSSRAHLLSGVDFEDPNFDRRPYEKFKAYGQSKSANALFALGLDTRGEDHGVRAFSVHPGVIVTDLVRDLTDDELKGRFGISHGDPLGYVPAGKSVSEGGVFKSVAQGAATAVWCATSAQLEGRGGLYCEDVNIAVSVPADHPGQNGVRPWAIDRESAERLWSVSERLTGVGLRT